MRRNLIGLVIALIFVALLLAPLPGMYTPSSLMSMADPLTGVWGSVYTAQYPSRGRIAIPGLENTVTVVIDNYGVPHIFAKSEVDVAYVLGYLHAHDRLFQMDLQRRLVEGSLSEILGEVAYETDLFYRTIGLSRGAQKTLELLQKVSRGESIDYYLQLDVNVIKDDAKKILELIEAYCKGVNTAIEEMKRNNALSLEFKLLGYEPKSWTPADCFKIGRLITWGLTGTFADLEVYLIYLGLISRYGVEYGTRLFLEILPIDRPIDHLVVPKGEACLYSINFTNLVEELFIDVTNNARDVIELLKWFDDSSSLLIPIRSMFASNNWVIGGNLTETRRPLLCDDPHLALTVPSVWYEVHYVVENPRGDLLNVRGVTLPGIGLVIIGSTQYVGWGFTNVMADHIDFYYYVWNDKGQYWYKGSWRDVESVSDVIVVKTPRGYERRTITLNFTVHGPIIERGGMRFAVCWMGERFGSLEVLALYKYIHAKKAEEFLKATYYFQMPPQNHVFADIHGNFGWIAAGWYPNRTYPNGTRAIDVLRPMTALIPRMPINGSSVDVIEWNLKDWIDATEAPMLWNPKVGYVVTANNRLIDETYPYTYDLAWTFADYYRAYRIDYLIREAIGKRGFVTIDDMKKMQNDVFYVPAAMLIPEIEKSARDITDVRVRDVVKILKEWNYSMLPELVAPTIFVRWLDTFVNMTLADEFIEISATVERFRLTRGEIESLVRKIPRSIIEALVRYNPNSKWFDDVFTPEVENATIIIRKSLERTIDMLEKEFGKDINNWRFSNIHKLRIRHILGTVFSWLNYPEWAAWGWSDCVNNIGAAGTSGPSWREILNFKDLNQSLCIIPGGQSGNPFSKHYYDQLRAWLHGEYKVMDFPVAPAHVKNVESILEFIPR